VPLGKLSVSQLVKKILAFYRIQISITVYARTRYWSLPWPKKIPFTPSHSTSLTSISILSSHSRLGLPRGSLSFRFSSQNPVCISVLSHTCHMSRLLHSPLVRLSRICHLPRHRPIIMARIIRCNVTDSTFLWNSATRLKSVSSP